MEFAHYLSPASLKQPLTSTFVQLPQNFRIISRSFGYFFNLRLTLTIAVVSCALLLLFKNEHRYLQVLGDSAATDESQYLTQGIAASEDYFKYGSSEDLDKAMGTLQLSLEHERENPYAVRLLTELQNQNNSQLIAQIEKVNNILVARPDYAAAWLKLSILYRDWGDNQLADSALDRAKKFSLGF